MYRVTQAGRQAWETQDAAVPQEYRLLLWLIDMQGAKRAIRDVLDEQPASLLQQWLGELEELGLLEKGSGRVDDTTLPLRLNEPLLDAGRQAAASLSRTGAYLAVDPRRAARQPKPPGASLVLIVEDDPDQRALADLRVSMAGYRVASVASVSELLRRLRTEGAPDLLLLDVRLGDGNGFDVLAGLRRHPRFAALPIVMLTAESDPAHIGKGLAWGADGYVTKPYSKNVLAEVMKAVLA